MSTGPTGTMFAEFRFSKGIAVVEVEGHAILFSHYVFNAFNAFFLSIVAAAAELNRNQTKLNSSKQTETKTNANQTAGCVII